MQKFVLCLINTSEDVILILEDACRTCAQEKVEIIKEFPVDKEEVRDLMKNYGVRACRVICKCEK